MIRLPVLLVLGMVASGTVAAEPTDLATLFPAGVQLYAEVGNPAETSTALAKFLQDTVLADTLAFSHTQRDKLTTPELLPGFQLAQSIGLYTSPEALAEMKRLRGAAVAVMGVHAKSNRPNWAAAVLLGESHGTALQIRTYLTQSSRVRRVGKLDGGVLLFQNRGISGPAFAPDVPLKLKPDPEPTTAEGQQEITYLYVPGLFVMGSGRAAVENVYRRFTGKETSASFAASPLLKAASAQRNKAGVFVLADTQAVLGKSATLRSLLPPEALIEAPALARFLLNPKAVPSLTGNLLFEPGGIGLSLQGTVSPEKQSPLHLLLSGAVLEANTIRQTADARYGFTVQFPDKTLRAKAILGVADEIAVAKGRIGALPSERVAEAKEKGFRLEDDWLSKVVAATIFQPAKQDRPKGMPDLPMISLKFETPADAERWEAELPKLLAFLLGTDQAPDPGREVVKGVRVSGVVVPHEKLKIPFHYARVADRLVMGLDQMLVVDQLKETEKPAVAGAAQREFVRSSFGTLRLTALLPEEPAGVTKRRGLRATPATQIDELPLKESLPDQIEMPDGQIVLDSSAELLQLYAAIQKLAPLQLQAGTRGDTIHLELWHRDSRKAVSVAFERGLIWFEKKAAEWAGMNRNYYSPTPIRIED